MGDRLILALDLIRQRSCKRDGTSLHSPRDGVSTTEDSLFRRMNHKKRNIDNGKRVEGVCWPIFNLEHSKALQPFIHLESKLEDGVWVV
jgi:hypothetical protein